MKNKKKENSVRSLINLYTVVMGVALSFSITSVIQVNGNLNSVDFPSVLLFLAFIVTMFPFYHGALRHLDDAYIENDVSHIRNGALIFDFLLLFVHGVAFVVLSLLIRVPSHFAWALVVLFTIDVIWGVFAHFGSSSRNAAAAEWKWTVINIFFVLVSVCFLNGNNIYLNGGYDDTDLALKIFSACLLRSIIDYIWCVNFYFPSEDGYSN